MSLGQRALSLAIVVGLLAQLQGTALVPLGGPVSAFDEMPSNALAALAPPTTLSYNPNSMRDVPKAEPGAGITLVEPPVADNSGGASLSYPIEVPPGRNGMQPRLSIAYASEGGNSWLGLGWDLATPSITIDTRWGVPRYDAALETETYVLDGEQLTPVAHRADFVPRQAEKVFHTRVEGEFQRIVRHGDRPSNYWWEVTQKDGTRYLYGGDVQSGGPQANATLARPDGSIYRWALREVRNNDNSVKYSYARVSDVGVAGGSVAGTQLYLTSINYTQFRDAPGPYTVSFIRDSQLPGYQRRPDVQIDARGGFKVVTAELLKRIEVRFTPGAGPGQLVRSYDLEYQEGAFKKTLLASVTQRGEDGSVFHTHRFTYHQGEQRFGPAEEWNTGNDNVSARLISLGTDYGAATALGGTVNFGGNGHVYVGFNPTNGSKEGSFGFKGGFDVTDSVTALEFIDINGDNLPDKVFQTLDGRIRFRLNQSGPGGGQVFGPDRELPSLPTLSNDLDFGFSFGPEAYEIGNVLQTTSLSFALGLVYFSDVNGDGLPDLVNTGQVLFNHLDANGIPTFTADSGATPVPLPPSFVIADGLIEDYEALYQQQIDQFPLHDTLLRWVAPWTGTVRITGSVNLVRDTSTERARYATADGVRVAIQHNGTELWVDRLVADDYAPRNPTGVNAIPVLAGDRLYFRVQSVFDGKYDQVAWDPRIEYVGPSGTDVNGLNLFAYQRSTDFVLAGRRGMFVQMPVNGMVRLTGALRKLGPTSDDITLLVLKNGTAISSQTLLGTQTGTLNPPPDFAVLKGDRVELRVKVDSAIDLRQIEWQPSLFYIATDPPQPVTDEQGRFTFQLNPPYDIDMYPLNNLTTPQATWPAPGGGMLTVRPQLTLLDGSAQGVVAVTVKRAGSPGQLLGKRIISVPNDFPIPTPNLEFSVPVQAGDALYFDFSADNPLLQHRLAGKTIEAGFGGALALVPAAFHSAAFPDLFPQPYRGWGAAGYNGNRGRATSPIDESRLTLPGDVVNSNPNRQRAQDFFKDAPAWPFAPFPAQQHWRGPDDFGWVSAGQVSSSRLGRDFFSVPRADDFGGRRAPQRFGLNNQVAAGGGVSLLSGSLSTGRSWGFVDYLDLNGDGFPDVLGKGGVQFTLPQGRLEPRRTSMDAFDSIRSSDATELNFGVGGSAADFKHSSTGQVNKPGKSGGPSSGPVGKSGAELAGGSGQGGGKSAEQSGSDMLSLGLGGTFSRGDSKSRFDLLDMNGDGLPDQVEVAGGTLMVGLNLGYDFAPKEPWGSADLEEGENEGFSVGASLGYNGGIYDFAGGVSLAGSRVRSKVTLLDLNGDGLPDRVRPGAGSLRVAFNTGQGFAPETTWAGALREEIATSAAVSLGGGLYFTIGIGPLCWPTQLCYIILNPGADLSVSITRDEAGITDVNGDGFPDYVTSDRDSSLRVAPSLIGRANLLQRVQRPLGGVIDLDYARVGNTYHDPASHWVLSQVRVFDGHPGDGVDTQITAYTYEQGQYDRREREFYGFGRVTESHLDPSRGNAVYRSIVREYRTDSYYTKGLLRREWLQDAAGNKFTETENDYRVRDVTTGGDLVDLQSTTATGFPQLVRTERRFYEGQPTPGKTTHTAFTYDALGNVTQVFEAGDPGPNDDLLTTFEYTDDLPLCVSNHIVGLATRMVATNSAGATLRHREATIDCNRANTLQLRHYLADGGIAVTDLTYEPNDNLASVTGPANLRGQRYQLTYAYDPVVQTHRVRATDSFGYVSTATHNYAFGLVTAEVDVNGNVTSFTYDAFGRVTSVRGPYDQGSGPPTIQYAYHPEAPVPWALTRQLDTFRSATDPIDTVVFTDGLKRVLQTKQDATLHQGPNAPAQDRMIVSGRIRYDAVGRVVQQRYPLTEPLGTPGTFNPGANAIEPTCLIYDVLDRTVKIDIPGGTRERWAYGFGLDRAGVTQFETIHFDANTVSDPNEALDCPRDGDLFYPTLPSRQPTRIYRNVRNLVTSVREMNAGQASWTSYTYSPLRQLTQVIDDRNNLTRVEYDALGRRTAIESPDSGRTELFYDLASNLTGKITANLRARGGRISYDYDFTRLTAITYPTFPDANVTYTYGAPGAPSNGAGRVVRITDQSGERERAYGRLGEITRETRTIPRVGGQGRRGGGPAVYTTQYTYDTYGRLQSLTYPDGEVLTYRYDAGGLLREAVGQKGNFTYPYIKRYEYDEFGMLVFSEAGNNVRTRYTYNPEYRLVDLITANLPNGREFQILAYSYDNVGYVLGMANSAPQPPPSEMGGPMEQTFELDDLYRLISATGSYRYSPNQTRRYQLGLAYDSIHNIVAKQQLDEIVQPSGNPVRQHPTTYTFAYSYGSPRPHAATHIGERTYTFDASGNQLGWTHDQNGTRRTIVWDDEHRMRTLSDSGHTITYVYDDAGQRVAKRGPQGETVYVNREYTVRNGELGTKHVFAGATRFASKLQRQGAGEERDLFYYHTDLHHTTNFVTGANGTIYQHFEFFPFGEPWVQETANTQRTPYLFTGQELDEETGLYSFDARYYDGQTSAWLSVDPILADYLDGGPSGGVYNSRNLSPYAYAFQNPSSYLDMDGQRTTSRGKKINAQLRSIARFALLHLPGQSRLAGRLGPGSGGSGGSPAGGRESTIEVSLLSTFTFGRTTKDAPGGGRTTVHTAGVKLDALYVNLTKGRKAAESESLGRHDIGPLTLNVGHERLEKLPAVQKLRQKLAEVRGVGRNLGATRDVLGALLTMRQQGPAHHDAPDLGRSPIARRPSVPWAQPPGP